MIAIIGWAGAAALLIGYALLITGHLHAERATYLALNFGGSACLALSTAAAHAWPSSTVNVLWLFIGIGPLVRAIAHNPRRRRGPVSARANGRATVTEADRT